jgi:hypothetical protein
MEQQKHGNVLSIPKNDIPTTTAESRQITLLNTEYKILARIRRNRLKPTLCLLHSSQYFEVPGTTIFDALTMVWVLQCTQIWHTPHPLCVPSLHFTTAFGRISHSYLLRMLKSYGYSKKFITLLQTMWYETLFSVQINGCIARPFPTRWSVTQICPMSKIPFALVLNPLICLCHGGRIVW